MAVENTVLSLGYADFGAWYDEYRDRVLDPALAMSLVALEAALDDALSDRDRTRIRRISGRVKSKRRAWRKLRRQIQAGEVDAAHDAPAAIHDLVGLRITCTNLRDIEMVQAALDSLPAPGDDRAGLHFDPNSERDYVLEPKESGYRGWHVNLEVGVKTDKSVLPTTVELQVRTLLQDSWGELTHEDTYSKDGALPPLVEVLSKRMADLFATLDDIAEDLRSELDRIDRAAVDHAAPDDTSTLDLRNEQAADAASVLLDHWSKLDRPVDLAALAWELQTEFGAEISDGWFGAGSFKRFVLQSIPDAEISTGRQAYLLPTVNEPEIAQPGTPESGAAPEADGASGVPGAARELRRVDASFPLLDAGRWTQLFAQLAEAWRRTGQIEPTAQSINRLTRSARDRARSMDEPISRRHLDHVAKAVVADSGAPLTADAIATAFSNLTLQRMVDLRIIGQRDRQRRARVERWFGITTSEL